MSHSTGAFIGLILIAFSFFIYFVPTFIGANKKYFSGIFVLNLFLGWTLIGWVGALAWAVSSPKKSSHNLNRSFDGKESQGIKVRHPVAEMIDPTHKTSLSELFFLFIALSGPMLVGFYYWIMSR